jgi:hypothetical protein
MKKFKVDKIYRWFKKINADTLADVLYIYKEKMKMNFAFNQQSISTNFPQIFF